MWQKNEQKATVKSGSKPSCISKKRIRASDHIGDKMVGQTGLQDLGRGIRFGKWIERIGRFKKE